MVCLLDYKRKSCDDCPVGLLCAWYNIMLEDEELGNLGEEKMKFSEFKDFINRIRGDLDKLVDINNQLRKIMFKDLTEKYHITR